ncbi:MAG: hypothetical protein GY696_12045 [Gammaproteobacteria bacterium]|nr:hypothetical protein [Gammaproteobacteria bacterium]
MEVVAGTGAGSIGQQSGAFGESEVAIGQGIWGRVGHGAFGEGQGQTGAASGGTVGSSRFFGTRAVGTNAEAEAFGSLESYSKTEGEAEMSGRFNVARAGSMAGSNGTGASASRSGASVFSIRD